MMLLPSSIFSSDAIRDRAAPRATLVAFPWPTPAGIVAVIVFVALGGVLAVVGGPYRARPGILATCHRYNANNEDRGADVLLLGDSLMDQGVIEGQLAEGLGLGRAEVSNLAVHGARAWDVEQLVGGLDPPRTSGPRVAVIQVDRSWFNEAETPAPRFARSRLGEFEGGGWGGWLRRRRAMLDSAIPERRQALEWIDVLRYRWLARIAPGLVRPPVRQPPKIWDLDASAQKRAARNVADRAEEAVAKGEFAVHSTLALRLAVDLLKRRSYRVVLLLTPLRREILEKIEASPISAARERRLREDILDARAIGADHVIEYRDAAALGIANDDAIFIDYGHLNRLGAEVQTRKLADSLRRPGLLGGPRGRPARPGPAVGGDREHPSAK